MESQLRLEETCPLSASFREGMADSLREPPSALHGRKERTVFAKARRLETGTVALDSNCCMIPVSPTVRETRSICANSSEWPGR